ncbi:spore germination protein [Clostridium sp. SYSU_GA19001]|uniref:spore germination protein n=1 Tax=Clostridium caldaquaticum TaxID=2940653 RepID=UPI002076E35D|nr:spore germination protein [Clostridium caldaquaticum]MCM8709707.1 spore germination protein [Clostridium caldaquaticum]
MKEIIRDLITPRVDENIAYLKELFKDNADIVYREFNIAEWKAAIVYIDGMADKILINNFVLESLMLKSERVENVMQVKDNLLTVSDMKEELKLSDAVNGMLSGETLMFVDGIPAVYVIATRFWPARGVSEPSGETVIRGGRDGFTETIRFNTALIRRRIRDTRLKITPKSVGVRSKTDVSIIYIDDIVNKDVLKRVEERIESINIDAILDSGYVEQMIEDNKWSPFPQMQSTERPDVVAAALYEGRVAILVDNSPFVIIVPATLPSLFQTPDDYYQRWINSSMLRIIRFFAIFTGMILPSLYVAVTSFHTSIIPTKFAYSIAASREGVPFPAFVETIIMEIAMAFLIEAVVRLPKAIGSTIGIVGGLIIGQAAVSAGIVSPIMIIIISVTAISSFITPNYEVSSAFRLARFLLIIAASIIGLYGIALGLIIILIHLVKLKSFGIPYLSPLVHPHKKDFKDMFIRAPFRTFKNRPEYIEPEDKIRQS